jgi:hypothetical protein
VSDVIWIPGSYNIVQGFEIRNGKTGGISLYGGNHNQILQNNIHNNGNVFDGGDQGQDGVYSDQYTSDNVYYGNYVHDNGRISLATNKDHGLYLSGDNEVVVNNLIVSNCSFGIQVDGEGTTSNMKIYNNTIIGNRNRSGMVLEFTMSGVDIANNIFYGNAGFGITTYMDQGSGVTISNNLFYANRDGNWNVTNNLGNTIYGNITNSNPSFVNSTGDWHLNAGSPAIDAGLTRSVVTNDFDLVPRPQGAAYDIGAYERAGTGTTRLVPSQYSTIQSAYDACNPGDTVLVANGTYTNPNQNDVLRMNKNGSPGLPIIVMAANAGGATLDGQNVHGSDGYGATVYIVGDYNVLKGFKIKNGYYGGVSLYSWQAGSSGSHNQIVQNEIFNNGGVANSTGGQDGIYDDQNTSNNSYVGNYIHDNGRISSGTGLDHGLYLSGTNNEVVMNNLIVGNASWGIQVAAYANLFNMQIYNNTIVSNRYRGGIVLWSTGGCMHGIDIANNIIEGNARPGVLATFCCGDGVQIRNNLFWNNAALDGYVNWYMTYNGSTVSYTASGNITNSAPGFVNDGSNWHLSAGSPAIDAGLTLSSVTDDYDGTVRPQGAAYDIGAYEGVGTGTTRLVPSQYSTIQSAYDACSPGDTRCSSPTARTITRDSI